MKKFLLSAALLSCFTLGVVGCKETSQNGSATSENVNNDITFNDPVEVAQPEVSENVKATHNAGYIIDLIKKSGGDTLTLDLSDEKQYEFIKTRMKLNGKNKENAAEEFAKLEFTKQNHERRKIGANGRMTAMPNILGPVINNNDHMITSVQTQDNKNTFSITATASIKNGASYVYVDAIAYEKVASTGNGNMDYRQLTNYAWKEERFKGFHQFPDYQTPVPLTLSQMGKMGNLPGAGQFQMWEPKLSGTKATVEVSAPLPNNGKLTVIDVISYKKSPDANGVEQVTVKWVQAIIGKNAGVTEGKFVINEPSDKNSNNEILVCLDRSDRDCDYPAVGNRYIKVPFRGSIRLPYKASAADIIPEKTYIKLYGPAQGGTTRMSYQGVDGSGLASVLTLMDGPGSSTIVSWDIPRDHAWFKNEDLKKQGLFDRLSEVNWAIKIGVRLKPTAVGGAAIKLPPGMPDVGIKVDFVATSDPEQSEGTVLENSYLPLKFKWSCLAEGSMIRMANGAVKAIENIKVGEKVKAKGVDLTVIDISKGYEPEPMIKITDESMRTLLLTSRHPLPVKGKGMTWASEVKVGDMIMTESGLKKVIHMNKKVNFTGKVFNLKLGTDAEVAAMPKGANLMYAQGILVGDARMQEKYEFKY